MFSAFQILIDDMVSGQLEKLTSWMVFLDITIMM